MKIIVIIVSPKGESRVETRGFVGSECQQASRFIEDALGKRTGETLTAEFHQQQHGQNRVQEEADMTTVRRRIQRPTRPPTAAEARRLARVQKKHEQLAKEQAALKRWMTKLKRAFHTVEKQQQRIARLERQLADLEQSG